MANNKITKVEALTAIRALVEGNEDLLAFVDKELELLAKRKNSISKAQKEKIEERDRIADKIVEGLANTSAKLSTMEIGTAVGISPQKATPILKLLVEENKIKKENVKGKNVYSII